MTVTKVCVLTGALGAVGSATVKVFEEAGRTVDGWDIAAVGGEGNSARRVDVTVSQDVEEAAAAVLEEHGRVDALVNNAAIQVNRSLLDTDDDAWNEVLSTNLSGAFHCTRALASALTNTAGAIVNVSSVHAIASSPNAGAYAVSKGALVTLTRVAALELGALGVRCNAVLPGAIDSPMLRDGLSRRPHVRGPDGNLDELRARTPLGSIASPTDVARSILLLADSDATPFITGAAMVVDGGATLRLATE